ncbi:MAG: metal ABC transporter permease [Negativicutes bacterium]|jgi:zinc transport system permease protein
MELFQHSFMIKALLVGAITAVLCPMLGLFIVVRRQSLIGDGIGHIAFAGVMIGIFFHAAPLFSAVVAAVTGAVVIELVRRKLPNHADMALAIMFYIGMALAVIFMGLAKPGGGGVFAYLFGSILTVSYSDILIVGVCSFLVAVFVLRNFKQLMITVFDEDVALTMGINTNRLNFGFGLATAITVVVGMTVLGVLLVGALMILPVAAALLLRLGFIKTMVYAVAFAELSIIGGLVLSYYCDFASGATIVVTASGIFFVLALYAKVVKK